MNNELGARKNPSGQSSIDCEKRDKLPDISFMLGGSSFVIGPYDYILEVSGSCISSFTGLGEWNL